MPQMEHGAHSHSTNYFSIKQLLTVNEEIERTYIITITVCNFYSEYPHTTIAWIARKRSLQIVTLTVTIQSVCSEVVVVQPGADPSPE